MHFLTRRRFLLLLGSAAGLSACGLELGLGAEASFDEVLRALHAAGPTTVDGLTNHLPMAAEALAELGVPERVVAWVQAHQGDLIALPEAAALPDDERASALGDAEQSAAWIARYVADVEALGVQAVIDRDHAMLLPGWFGAGWHGALRVGHALRSLDRGDTADRRREVAHGLGYMAALFQELPGAPGASPEAGLDPVAALAGVPLVAAGERVTDGTILDRVAPTNDLAGLAESIERVDLDAVEVSAGLAELAAAAARMFLSDGADDVVLLHAVTGTSAARLWLPWLDAAAQRALLGFAFQSVAVARSATRGELGTPGEIASDSAARASVLEVAAQADDAHVIKLGEAALREHGVVARPELLEAALAWQGF